MPEHTQVKRELLSHLREQVKFMKAAADAYDNGFEGEAKRLAVVIRILVHDTMNATSLLSLLGKKDILLYDSAAAYDPRTPLKSDGLTIMKLTSRGPVYVAPLDNLPPSRNKDKKTGFASWWEKNTIFENDKGDTFIRFTRKDFVLAAASKEGETHIDPKLDKVYASLSRFNSSEWKVFSGGEEKDFNDSPFLPRIRQIAHEVLKTLKDEFPELF